MMLKGIIIKIKKENKTMEMKKNHFSKGTRVKDTITGLVGVVEDAGWSWVDIRWDDDDSVSIGEPTWKLERI